MQVFKKWANLSMEKYAGIIVSTTHGKKTLHFIQSFPISRPPLTDMAKFRTKRAKKILQDYITNTYKFAWTCTNEACDFIIQRHSRSVDVNRHCCGKCNAQLVEIEVPAAGSTSYVKKQKRKATGFSLFLQQQSQSVRASLSASRGGRKVSQNEVMKECSRLWKELKDQDKMLKR